MSEHEASAGSSTPTVILLGAGASVDAGVPTSTALTQRITEALGSDTKRRYSEELHALNVAIGAMMAHDTARGAGAFDGIDVERLFSAIEMLADRDSLEIAPFVTSWNSGLDGLPFQSNTGGGLFDAIKMALTPDPHTGNLSPFGETDVERAFVSGVKDIIGGYDGSTFDRLRDQMIEQLRVCLRIEPGASDHLAPLLNAGEGVDGPLAIATLNYDRGVEEMASRWSRSVSTGLSGWDGTFGWSWPDDVDIRLLKLHGSLDWSVSSPPFRSTPGRVRPAPEFVELSPGDRPSPRSKLGVVFGQRGKVRSEGPFLAMLREFDQWLKNAQRLVVVGYSFRDEHINRLIRKRLEDGRTLEFAIVDPGLPKLGTAGLPRNMGPFLGELLGSMTTRELVKTDRRYEYYEPKLIGHHQTIRAGAKDGLTTLFGPPPPSTG